MNWIQLAQEEAEKLGVYLPKEVAEHILWEKTAFPCADEGTVRAQVTEALHENLNALRKIVKPADAGPSRYERLTSLEPESSTGPASDRASPEDGSTTRSLPQDTPRR